MSSLLKACGRRSAACRRASSNLARSSSEVVSNRRHPNACEWFPNLPTEHPLQKFYLCRTGALAMAIRHTRMTWTCKRLGRRSRLAEHMVSRWFWCVKPRLLHDMSVELVGGKPGSLDLLFQFRGLFGLQHTQRGKHYGGRISHI